MAIDTETKQFASMEFPLSLKRQDAFPLDGSCLFTSLAQAQEYAASDPTAYAGQLIVVAHAGIALVYVIEDTAGTLCKLRKEVRERSYGSNVTALTLADNTEYRLTGVSELTLAFPAGRFECWLRVETAQGEAPQITFPESARFLGAEPEFAAGRCYEISVKDGVCIVAGEAA